MPGGTGYGALMGTVGGGNSVSGSPMGRSIAGALGGFGQGMMDPNMRRTYGTARSGGYHDLMENQRIGDFVTGDISPELAIKFQNITSKMTPARRGVAPMPGAPGGMSKGGM